MSDHRCRLCTTNDLESLVEDCAIAMWETYRSRQPGEAEWSGADEYWQMVFRGYARSVVGVVRSRSVIGN